MRGAMDFGIADDGERASREQTAQVAIASLADIAEPVFTSCRSRKSHPRGLARWGARI